ncbi:MAG: hypothetical protein V1859_02315 [archaeon]
MIKINIETLRVFNALKKLGITETEFSEIEKELNSRIRTGLAIVCVKQDYSICVSHDERHQIVIRKIVYENKAPMAKSRILFKTLTNINDLPDEIYTLHSIAQYRALDDEIYYVADTLEELKDRICDRFSDNYPKELGDAYDEVYPSYNEREKNKVIRPQVVDEQLKSIFWLFNEPYSEILKASRDNIARIVKVFSRNNRRVAIIQECEEYNKQRSCGLYSGSWYEHISKVSLKIKTFTPRDRRYNYVCPGREVYLPHGWEENGQIWLDDNLSEKVTHEELKVLSRRVTEERNNWILLTADSYNSMKNAVKLELLSAKRKATEDSARKNLVQSIQKSFSEGKAVRCGIEFTKKSVSYQGISFTGNKISLFLSEQNVLFMEQPDFTNIYESYIDWLLDPIVKHNIYYISKKTVDFKFKGKELITVKGIKIILEKKGNNLFINNLRICKEDAAIAIKKAISFATCEEYNNWLKTVSILNLKLQKAFEQGGLDFELMIDKTDDNCLLNHDDESRMLLSISLIREKNKNYTVINSTRYKIKDINALLSLSKDVNMVRLGASGGGYLQRTIKILYQAIDGISPKEIGELIENGKDAYESLHKKQEKERLKKLKMSKKFIENAVRLSKAEKIKNGFLVQGLSGTIYFVGSNLSVYTTKNGKTDKYLCIIDIGTEDSESGRNDAIAKRLLMLSKDKVVADELYDLGDKMDHWWLRLREPVSESIQ